MTIAILYEHPSWNDPLFAEFARRDVEVERLDASDPGFNFADVGQWRLLVNRMSASAWARGNGVSLTMAPEFLRRVELEGVSVVNGWESFEFELSKSRQVDLFQAEGASYPATKSVADTTGIEEAAALIGFPILVKPDAGGSGIGINAFLDAEELADALAQDAIEFGPGGGVVQERIQVEDGAVTRLEVLNGELLYAIRLKLKEDTFNMCPADYCAVGPSSEPAPAVQRIHPPAKLAELALALIRSADADLGSVEYLIDGRDGRAKFIDLNVNSNFVADAPRVLGFDPWKKLVDYLLARAGL